MNGFNAQPTHFIALIHLMLLTVVIPTYNRNQPLLATLERLLPQLEREAARVRLLVIDNASPTPAEETLAPLLARFPEAQVEVRRNRANIGANANILRCFELCETPYLWTLGDDDQVKPDALDTIFAHIEAYPDCVFFNFGVEHAFPRSKTTTTRGALDFVRGIDFFGNAIFISTNVYRNDALLPSLKFAHHYTYSAAPQFVMVLQSLGTEGECCLTHTPIVSWSEVEGEQQWSRVVLALGVRTLLEMPLDPRVRAALAQRLTHFDDTFLPVGQLLLQLLLVARTSHDRRGPLYLWDQLCHRRHNAAFYGDSRPKRRLEAWEGHLILRFPHLGLALMKLNNRLKKYPPLPSDPQSFSGRL